MPPLLLTPLDTILGSAAKVRLLRALLPLDRPVSGREAARLAGLSHRAVLALDELAALGVLERRTTAGGHTNLYGVNRSHALVPAIVALFEAERERTAAIVRRIARVLKDVGGVEASVVFGSQARGDAGPTSDLDLLVLTATGARERVHDAIVEAAPSLESELGVRLSPVVLTLTQARRQHAAGDAFLAAALRDARRVSGAPLEELLDG